VAVDEAANRNAAADLNLVIRDVNGAPAQFIIAYIAGVHVTGVNTALYKVVYRLKDCAPGDDRHSWERLSALVETMPAVRNFHTRWALSDLSALPVGFKWEHHVPEFNARVGRWACTFPGCTVRMKEEHNVRQHAGSVHGRRGGFDCDLCGQHCSTKTNQLKHKKRKHAAHMPPPLNALGISPADIAAAAQRV